MDNHSHRNGRSVFDRTSYGFEQLQTNRQLEDLHGHDGLYEQTAAQKDSLLAPDAVIAMVEDYIKQSPAKSLLIAAAAGLAIGWWVKR